MRAPAVRDDVLAFHHAQIVIDLHVDCVIQQRLFGYDIRRHHEPWMRRQPLIWHTDIPRMIEGGYTGCCFGLHYWPWESKRGWDEIRKQFDYIDQVVELDARCVRAASAADFERAHREGRFGCASGLEGAHMIAGDLACVDEAVARGALYMTLAHFSENSACIPGMGRGARETGGLTPFGRELVAYMNARGLIVDVAHMNHDGALEAATRSTKPVIASHTMCRAVIDHPRGMRDEALRAVAATGGVVGIILAPIFYARRMDAPLSGALDHIFHVADLLGPEHLALGSDFDGWVPTIPNDMRDVRDMPLLTQLLLDRGMGRDEVAGLLGRNFLRVLEANRPGLAAPSSSAAVA